jgi:hypothetical protein
MRRTILSASCAVMLASIVLPPQAVAQRAGASQTKTSKERLSRKADDEQRVDNCRVPVELRGPTPRPGCPGEQSTASSATR